MAIVDLSGHNIEDAQDPIAMPAGEYKIRIIECDGMRQNKDDNDYVLPRFEVVGEPLAKDFTHYVPLLTTNAGEALADFDEKRVVKIKAGIKNFCLCFGIDTSSFDTDELQGLEGWVILGTSDDDQYGEQNYIKKLVIGA